MARRFRDEQGLANQKWRPWRTKCHFVAAGLPLTLKG